MLFCRNYSLFHQKQFGANYNFPAIGSFTKPVVKSAALSESVSALIGSKAWKQDQINLAFFNSITAIDRFGNSEFSGFKCLKIFYLNGFNCAVTRYSRNAKPLSLLHCIQNQQFCIGFVPH